MRACASILAASLLAFAAPATDAAMRVASLNLCTDELLLLVGDSRQIASVSYLSQDPRESPLWQSARRFHGNDGSLLSVAGLAPTLVLTMGTADRSGIAHRLGMTMLSLPYPQTLSDVEHAIGEVARATGRPAAGQALQARIARLKRTGIGEPLDTVWLGGGGRSLAPNSLGAQWMALAGFQQRKLDGDRLTLEQLVVHPPNLLVRSNYRSNEYSSEQRWLSHPLVARSRRSRTLVTDGRRWTCLGPLLIPEIERLRRERAR